MIIKRVVTLFIIEVNDFIKEETLEKEYDYFD